MILITLLLFVNIIYAEDTKEICEGWDKYPAYVPDISLILNVDERIPDVLYYPTYLKYKENGVCVRFDTRYPDCLFTREGTYCYACLPGYGRDGKNCRQCEDPNCINCDFRKGGDEKGICMACNDTSSLVEGSNCKGNKIENCLLYSDAADYEGCLQCKGDLLPSSDRRKCVPCGVSKPGCAKCGNGAICEECEDGYLMDEDYFCHIKESKLANCKVLLGRQSRDDTTLRCKECEAPYVPVESTGVCTKVLSNCAVGKANYEGDVIKSYECLQCNTGYVLNEKAECVEGNFPRCTLYNGKECVQCEDGYYLHQSLSRCVTIPESLHCYQKDNNNHCLKCLEGYGIATIGNNKGQCIKCESDDCLECDGNNPSYCLRCRNGIEPPELFMGERTFAVNGTCQKYNFENGDADSVTPTGSDSSSKLFYTLLSMILVFILF